MSFAGTLVRVYILSEDKPSGKKTPNQPCGIESCIDCSDLRIAVFSFGEESEL
ncbi:hypothetical protein D3C86_2191760 [compost metagenome]